MHLFQRFQALEQSSGIPVLPSIRPPDDIVLSAVQMSGAAVFEELIDLEAIATMSDPLKDEILRAAGL